MRAIDADALQLAIVEEGQANKRKKYIIGDIWELTGAEIRDVINSQPTIQPEPHWIPVTERMPEEHEWLGTKRFGTTKSDEVYVTFENPKGERFCKHLSFQNGKLSAFDQSTIDAFFKGSRPVAWKPMPEPFKGVNV